MKQIFNIIKNPKIQFIFICLAVTGFLWLGTVFIELRLGLAIEQVMLDFEIEKDYFEHIEAFRVSPGKNRNSLIKDSDFTAFYGDKRGYFKSVEIQIPAGVEEHLQSVTLWIGKNSYTYNSETLFTQWKVRQEDDLVILTSGGSVGTRSVLEPLKSVMNWKGDLQVFVFSFFYTLFYVVVFAGAGLLLYRYVKKKTPRELSPGLYDYYLSKMKAPNNHIFSSAYQKAADKYTLTEDEKNGKHLPFIVDQVEQNAAGKVLAVLFGLIIITAVLQRFITIQLPIFTADSWGYIKNGVANYGKGGFIDSGARTFVYPYFLQVIIHTFKSFEAITYTQHLMGVTTSIFIYLIWLEAGNFFSFKRRDQLLYKAAGLIPLFVYALSDSAVVIEKYIMREGINPFFLAMISYFFIRLVRSLLTKKKLQTYIFANLFFVANYLIFVFQSRWGFTLLFNIALYALLLFFIFRGKIMAGEKLLKKGLLLIVLPLFLMFSLVYVPENFIKKGGNTSGSFLSPHLFFGHANIVTIEIEKDIEDPDFNKFDKKVLRRINAYIKDILANGDHSGFPKLGFNPDLFTYYEPNEYLKKNLEKDEFIYFCRYYFIKSTLKHPVLYIRKVLGQLSLFYDIKGAMYPGRMQSSDVHQYRGTFKFLYINNTDCFPYNEYYSRVKSIVNGTSDRNKISFAVNHFLLFFLGITYIPVLLIFCFLLGFIIVNWKVEAFKKLIIPGLSILYYYICNFCISFSNASIFILENRRYMEDQFLLVLLSQSLAIIFCLLVTLVIFKRRKESKKSI